VPRTFFCHYRKGNLLRIQKTIANPCAGGGGGFGTSHAVPGGTEFGGKLPPPPPSDNPPPNLFTAIQEQLGMKLAAVKAPADVMVIDKAKKPSAN
jgi:hypothetical protein